MKNYLSSSPAHSDAIVPPGLRFLIWLNVAVQIAFPLAVAFTPTMAGAAQHFLLSSEPLSSQRTQGVHPGCWRKCRLRGKKT